MEGGEGFMHVYERVRMRVGEDPLCVCVRRDA